MRARNAAAALCVAALAGACGATQGGPRAAGEGPAACPREATGAGAGCRCAPGLYVVDGACAGERDLEQYCGTEGAGAAWAPGGSCPTPRCPQESALDPAREICLGARDTRAALASERPVPDDATLGCRDGRILVAHGEHVTCLDTADTCARASEWSPPAGACAPLAPCPPGQLRSGQACVQLTRRAPKAPLLVDVAAWALARLGSDGGDGSPYLCRPFARQPWDFDVGPGGLRRIALEVTVLFPDNDVTQAKCEVTVADATSGTPLPPAARGAAGRGVESLVAALRAIGGTASAASMTSRVICVLRGGASPLVLRGPRSP